MFEMSKISFLIPVFNEEGSLEELHRQITGLATVQQYNYEIIFVDDGSTDSSWQILCELTKQDERVQCLQFRRNFGKAAALRAGAMEADGEFVITMDADLQDDPAEVPAMFTKLKEGYDLVSGWKQKRNDPLGKTLPSRVFNWLVGWMTGVKLHDHNCGFKLYRREIFDEIKLYGEMHRFVPVLAASRGFKVAEIPVHHRAREHGVSKYGWKRLPKGFLDLLTVSFLTGFSQRPQHLLGMFGLLSFLVGGMGLVYMTIYWVLRMTLESCGDWPPLHQRPLVLYSLGVFLLGTQLLCMGFLAELLVARGQTGREPYAISETRGGSEERKFQRMESGKQS